MSSDDDRGLQQFDTEDFMDSNWDSFVEWRAALASDLAALERMVNQYFADIQNFLRRMRSSKGRVIHR